MKLFGLFNHGWLRLCAFLRAADESVSSASRTSSGKSNTVLRFVLGLIVSNRHQLNHDAVQQFYARFSLLSLRHNAQPIAFTLDCLNTGQKRKSLFDRLALTAHRAGFSTSISLAQTACNEVHP